MGVAAFCQTQDGSILGTAKDPSGGVVPNATITITHQETGLTRTATTGPDGAYRVAGLPYGDFTVAAEAAGFKKYISRDIHLRVNEVLRSDVIFELGTATQEITVTGAAPMITTDTGEIAATQRPEFLAHNSADTFNAGWQVASATISATETYMQFYGNPATHTAISQDGIDYRMWGDYIMTASVQEIKVEALNAPRNTRSRPLSR